MVTGRRVEAEGFQKPARAAEVSYRMTIPLLVSSWLLYNDPCREEGGGRWGRFRSWLTVFLEPGEQFSNLAP